MEKVCKECGAVYYIHDKHMPFRDSNSIACECGVTLYEWDRVSKDFTETLKKHGKTFRLGAVSRYLPNVIADVPAVKDHLEHAARDPPKEATDPNLVFTLKRRPGGEILVKYYYKYADEMPPLPRRITART